MDAHPRMFRVPDDLQAMPAQQVHHTATGTVVSYVNPRGMQGQRVLICAPTLVHVRRGTKRLTFGTQTQAVEAGEVVLLRRGLHVMSEFVDGAEPYRSTLISLDDAALRAFADRYGSTGPSAVTQLWPILTPSPYLNALLAQLPTQLAHLPDHRLLGLKVEEILLSLQQPEAQAFWRQAIEDAHADDDVRFKRVIDQHSLAALSTIELANLSRRSLSAFKRDFARLYDAPPGRWLLHRRLDHAAGLLSAQRCNVTEASARSGFAEVSSFIRAFKRRFDVTPKQYQRRPLRAVKASA
jgi:AraC-like DNA-binding protein